MKNTKLNIVLFWVASALTISTGVYSQPTSSMHFPKVTFGEINGTVATKEGILANPKLICDEPDCEVTGFTFMILRKDRNIIGPYYINGSELTDKLITTLNALPSPTTKIFIDSVQVNYKGRKMQVPGIAFQYDH